MDKAKQPNTLSMLQNLKPQLEPKGQNRPPTKTSTAGPIGALKTRRKDEEIRVFLGAERLKAPEAEGRREHLH